MRNKLEMVAHEYQRFFEELGIDPESGVLEIAPTKKFATFPYIGSSYFGAKRKILFVGMDIGRDETPGRIQSFEERNATIECDTHFNKHIAGTYNTALYLLKEHYGWEDIWQKFVLFDTYNHATSSAASLSPSANVASAL